MGRSQLTKRFIFSNGNTLFKKIIQVGQIPIETATACLRILFKLDKPP